MEQCPKCGMPVMALYKEGTSHAAQCYNKHMWLVPADRAQPTKVEVPKLKLHAAKRLLAERNSEYIKRLKQMGIKPIDKGSMSHVFEHPTMPNVAVKVYIWNDGFSKYAKFCQQHTKNPYLLKVYDIHHDPKGFNYEGDYGDKPGDAGRTHSNIVFVEKLKPITKAQLRQFVAYCEEIAGVPKTGDTFAIYHQQITETRSKQLWYGVARQTKDRNLAQFAKWFVRLAFEGENIADIHDSNVMMRGSQVVFSDPLV